MLNPKARQSIRAHHSQPHQSLQALGEFGSFPPLIPTHLFLVLFLLFSQNIIISGLGLCMSREREQGRKSVIKQEPGQAVAPSEQPEVAQTPGAPCHP